MCWSCSDLGLPGFVCHRFQLQPHPPAQGRGRKWKTTTAPRETKPCRRMTRRQTRLLSTRWRCPSWRAAPPVLPRTAGTALGGPAAAAVAAQQSDPATTRCLRRQQTTNRLRVGCRHNEPATRSRLLSRPPAPATRLQWTAAAWWAGAACTCRRQVTRGQVTRSRCRSVVEAALQITPGTPSTRLRPWATTRR